MARTPKLFQPIEFRSVTARNRIAVAPMCQYSAHDGLGSDWHVQHLGARAVGGAGIVLIEATHVSDIGRITPGCLGAWNGEHAALLKRLAAVIAMGGAVPGIQIAHAGPQGELPPALGRRQADPARRRWLAAGGAQRGAVLAR